MKPLITSALLIACAPLSGAQAPLAQPTPNVTRTTQVKPKDILPQTTLEFKQVGDGLPVSAASAFLGYPVCGGDGSFYFNAITLPKGERQVFGVSPKDNKGEVSNYNLTSIMGLANVTPHAIDAEGSDLFVLVGAAKSDDLIDHDIQPNSAEARRYRKLFILHFHGGPSTPDVIPLDLPFEPEQFAATSGGKFVFLGLERTNQTPVLAVVDDSGELERYIDAYRDFGTGGPIVANVPQRLKSQFRNMSEGAQLDFALVRAQFVHYRGSLLLLMPGNKAKVFTIRGGGVLESTTLHLPAGFEAQSLISSDSSWLVRATDRAANGKQILVTIDPSTGKALRIIHSPQMNVGGITCVHDGKYYGIRWPTDKEGNGKPFLMKAAE